MARGSISRDSDPSEVKEFILSDDFLLETYVDVYRKMLDIGSEAPAEGEIVEVGGAPGLVKQLDPTVIIGDVVKAIDVDVVFSGEQLPFADNSVSQLLLKDTLHHLNDIRAFFEEAARVLIPGGMVIAAEPYWGYFARFVYGRLHPEDFDLETGSWSSPTTDRWSSNQALLGILLRRDRNSFEASFPNFRIREHGTIIGPSYLLSGGVYTRTPIPSSLLVRLRELEARWPSLVAPLSLGFIASFQLI